MDEALIRQLIKARENAVIAEAAAVLRNQELIAEYGPDQYKRGEVLIFRPHEESADQETRVAVKVGVSEWTLTARGKRRSWAEILSFVGKGCVLMKSTREVPVFSVKGEIVSES